MDDGRAMPRISFPDAPALEVAKGTPLNRTLIRSRYPGVLWGCCEGNCGTCRFLPGEGAEKLPPVRPLERLLLERIGAGPGERLACYIRVEHDLEVRPAPGLVDRRRK